MMMAKLMLPHGDDGKDLSTQNFSNESSIFVDDVRAVPLAIASKLHSHRVDHNF
jgi:hypothetical protein